MLALRLLTSAAVVASAVQAQLVNIPPSNTAPQVPYALIGGGTDWQPAANAGAYPNMPTVWPEPSEEKGAISIPEMLNSALVLDALAIVTKAVPGPLLQTAPSIRTGRQGDVTYIADPAANCYWPMNQCNAPSAADQATYKGALFPDVTSCPGTNTMGLTYDDGPVGPLQVTGPSTVDLVAQLATMKQQATFFNVGASMALNPAIAQQLCSTHEVALHTWTHGPLTSLDTHTIIAEIKYTEALIWYLCGVRARYARAPYGDVDNRVRAIFGALGYEMVLWGNNYDTRDADVDDVSQTEGVVLKAWQQWEGSANQAGFIELEHSLSNVTTQAAIDALKGAATLQAAGTLPFKMQTVGNCQSKSSYVPLGYLVGQDASSAATSSSASAAVASSSPSTKSPPSAQVTRTSSSAAAATGKASQGTDIQSAAGRMDFSRAQVAALMVASLGYFMV
ncbi:chitin deacetylase [Thoreauomyces humboldtii]|nr:chitin deacetylase [Thoreauomyces humboldtii]